MRQTANAENYIPGDAVEIYSGEQSGISGKVISVSKDIVTLEVTEGRHGEAAHRRTSQRLT